MASSSSSKKITLMTPDKEVFEIEEAVALQMQTIKHMIEDGYGYGEKPIPVENIIGKTLRKVIKYCEHHLDPSECLTDFDDEFINVDHRTLFDIILAAHFLEVQSLLDLGCKTVAQRLEGKSVEKMRETLKIKSDFSPKEEEEARKENAWAFDRN